MAQNGNQCPTDLALSSYVDRALPPASSDRVALHLRSCDSCRRRASELLNLSQPLEGEIPLVTNGDCPDREEWGQFLEGKASWGYRRRLDRHLLECARCRAEFARYHLGGVEDAGETPRAEILELVKGLVAPEDKLHRRPGNRAAQPKKASWPFIAAAAASAALFLGLFALLGQSPAPDTDSTKPSGDGETATVQGTVSSPSAPREGDETEPSGVVEPLRTRPVDPEPIAPGPLEPTRDPSPEEVEYPGRGPGDEATPPAETPEPGRGPSGSEEVEAPSGTPKPGPESRPDITESEIWERTEFQSRGIRSDAFGDLGAGAVAVRGDFLSLPRDGSPGVPVKVTKKGLLVDANGDGRPEVFIPKKGGVTPIRLTYAGGVPGTFVAKFFRDGETWFYRSLNCMAGRVAGVTAFLFDENGNGRFNDVGVDTIAIDSCTNYAFVSPVSLLGEELFHLRISDSGLVVEVKPYRGERGHLDVVSQFHGGEAQVVTAILANDLISVNAMALGWPVPVPVGKYSLVKGAVRLGRDCILFAGSKDPVVDVAADKIASLRWGGPLTIEFEYTRNEDHLLFDASGIHFTGVLGERYASSDRSTARARITIRDAVSCRILKEITQSLFVASNPGRASSSGG